MYIPCQGIHQGHIATRTKVIDYRIRHSARAPDTMRDTNSRMTLCMYNQGTSFGHGMCLTFKSTWGHDWRRVWDEGRGARPPAKDCGPYRPLARRSMHDGMGHQFWLLEEAGRHKSTAQRYSEQLSTRLTQGLSRLARTLAAPHVDIYLGT